MADLKKLQTDYESNSNQLKIFYKFLNTIEQPVSQTHIFQVEEYLQNARHIFEIMSKLQPEIEFVAPLNKLKDIQSEFEVNTNLYFSNIAIARTLIHQDAAITGNAVDSSGSTTVTARSFVDNSAPAIKLPQIKLPSFDGTISKWLEFRDMFDALVHNNLILTTVQKMCYLKASVIGDAAAILQSIATSADNYDIAYRSLLDRYNNKELIIQSHLKALFELNSCSRESAVSLRDLIDTAYKNIRSLKSLGEPTEHWDSILIYLVASKLDSQSRREWELRRKTHTIGTVAFSDLANFIKERWEVLESVSNNLSRVDGNQAYGGQNRGNHIRRFNTHLAADRACVVCKQRHMIYACPEFKALQVEQRLRIANSNHLCFNCLSGGHFARNCRSSKCRKCQGLHNTLLHLEKNLHYVRKDDQGSTDQLTKNELTNHVQTSLEPTGSLTMHVGSGNQVLLSTAVVQAQGANGELHTCTVLIDNASQCSIIRKEFAQKLRLNVKQAHYEVNGVNCKSSMVHSTTQCKLFSNISQYSVNIECVVLDDITRSIAPIVVARKNIPQHVTLADSNYNKYRQIDLLLAADVSWDIMREGVIRLDGRGPHLRNTAFGWIFTGSMPSNQSFGTNSYHTHINFEMERFWEIEHNPNYQNSDSMEDKYCEDHFVNNTSRDKSGRFQVKVPFKQSLKLLGDSFSIAEGRFMHLERKLSRDTQLKIQYVDFMREYLSLGHMSEVEHSKFESNYVIPHHCVIKPSSTTTKLRVVFDASCKTSTNLSLNDVQFSGFTVQDELYTILLRFRSHKYVLTGDIEKMYRQINLHPSERNYQLILWRENHDDKLKTYMLNTLTYGTSSAPFLATRCLKQLALETKSLNEIASLVIERDFYVDDLITGHDSEELLEQIKQGVIDILKSAGMKIRKFKSNSNLLCQSSLDDATQNHVSFTKSDENKILGIYWNSETDSLHYSSIHKFNMQRWSKRTILSSIAKLFDPLGILAPFVLIAKLLMQDLWQLKSQWDEDVPESICSEWLNYINELNYLKSFVIPRQVLAFNYVSIEIHGFSDASEKAYGACIYIKSIDQLSNVKVSLFTAKSRVAPLRCVSLPRLELMAAVLLSELYTKSKLALSGVKVKKCYLWSDSKIVLSWISSKSRRWKTFVANRVSQIQEETANAIWAYVQSKQNPADIISRGMPASELIASKLWWDGPQWLCTDNQFKVFQTDDESESMLPEARALTLQLVKNSFMFTRYSSLSKLQRITALCFRFIHNCSKLPKLSGTISKHELDNALLRLIKMSQNETFTHELVEFKRLNRVSDKSRIKSLSPIVDKEGILRVGGRLTEANLSFNTKHPILLDGKHTLAVLLARQIHIDQFHCGPQALLYAIRQNYWPVSGRNLCKKIVRNCITCFRHSPQPLHVPIGQLPKDRLTPVPAFYICGTDFAGPIITRDRKGRGFKKLKSYICIFVCFVTKACHIELVSDLSTEAFLAALRRFVARRGRPKTIYSDNGSNFVGANAELKELYGLVQSQRSSIINNCNDYNIEWRFSPARAPHFGGLWEAGVKSIKYHLKRVVGNAILTFEGVSTLLCQIEAILNSRPLSTLSSSPDDFVPLSPAHFLIGRPTTALPDPDLNEITENKLSLYQQYQHLQQQFWKRWHSEYLSQLNSYVRRIPASNATINVGDLVIAKDPNAPPFKWKTARIQQLHPGPDGITRVATIRFSNNSESTRAVRNLCRLPINDDCEKTNCEL